MNQPEWKLIETAPKVEGTEIIAWCVHAHAKSFKDPIAAGYEAAVHARWTDHNGGGWVWHGLMGTFTHWMPYRAGIIRADLPRPVLATSPNERKG